MTQPIDREGADREGADDERALRARAEDALRGVIDPELGIDVVSLGLVYDVRVRGGSVVVDLTLTTAACPLGPHIAEDARARIAALEGVTDVGVRLVWEPAWGPERMSPSAREALGWGAV